MKSSGNVGNILLLVALAAGVLVACGGPTGGVPPDTSGLAALDAQATLAVWSAQGTVSANSTAQAAWATADTSAAWAQGTASAEQATRDTAAVVAGNATATWAALVAQEKAVSVRQTADAGVYAMNATATADAAIAAFMQAEAAQTIAERQAEVARKAMWNRVIPWLAGAVVVTAVGLAFLVVGGYVLERVRRARPQAAGDTWVMWHPEGPRVIAPSRPSLPRVEPRALLAEGATHPPAPVSPELFRPSERGHVLVAGPSDSGKSTALRSVLDARQNVVVLDPHWDSKDWGAAQVIGGGRDFEAIKTYMEWMDQELQTRYRERLNGREKFQAHTVVIDEMPAIVDELGRAIATTWRRWLREGRKIGLYLVVSTQSTRVETLGIKGEGDLLENFSVTLVLGKAAREEYRGLVAGMERPAVLHTVAGARPVIIPNITSIPRPAPEIVPTGDLDGDGRGDALVLPPASAPLFHAPTPDYAAVTREPDPANLTNEDRWRIVASYRRHRNIDAVQEELFRSYRSRGGRAWKAIRRVLGEEGELPPYRPTETANGLNPPPGYYVS